MSAARRGRWLASASTLTLVVLSGAAGVVAAPMASAGACSGTSGVTVVVQSEAGTVVACAPGDPGSGLAALAQAGFGVDQVQRFPGAVCRINGYPASDPCVNMPPATAYWSYWHAKPGGSWSYSQVGAGSYNPAPGSVEGWRFGAGTAPSISPPSAPAPAPPPPPPATTAPPAAPSAPAGSTGGSAAGSSAGSSGSTSGSRPSAGTAASSQASGAATTGASPSPADAASASADPSQSAQPSASLLPSDEATALAAQSTTPATETRSRSPWPLVVGVGLLATFGAAAAVVARRRRHEVDGRP